MHPISIGGVHLSKIRVILQKTAGAVKVPAVFCPRASGEKRKVCSVFAPFRTGQVAKRVHAQYILRKLVLNICSAIDKNAALLYNKIR